MMTILVPLDGSALAEQVLPFARLLAMSLSARIHLLHVVTDFERADVVAHEIEVLDQLSDLPYRQRTHLPQDWAILSRYAESYLAAPAASLREAGLETTTEVRFGLPAEIIVDEAERQQATLIAMATHGRSGLQRWALGSVADKVLHGTTIPLLLIRTGMRADWREPRGP
jgi:nucleotide-binding universal stress UspA family protein